MIASVQKPNQTKATSAVVTNTSAVGQNPVVDSKFTRAEVGQQGLVRSIDRKMDEMNQRKSEAVKVSLHDAMLGKEPTVAEDRSFSSTNDLNQVPQRVRDILESHEVYFTEGDRIVHIPGANYFHLLHHVDDKKEFTMFSLDEDIRPPVVEEESAVVLETPTSEPEPAEMPLGTLGTLGYQPEIATPVTESVTEREPAFITEMKPESVVEVVKTPDSPLQIAQKLVDTKRTASAREFGPYIANRYKDKISGSFSELFGNNTKIQESLFKTIRDYDLAKHDYLVELAKTNPEKSAVIDWLHNELIQLSLVLPHDRLHLFIELAHVFHTGAPTTLETRNRVISTMPATGKIVPIAEKLGIHGAMQAPRAWETLFIHQQPKELPISRVAIAPTVTQMEVPFVAPVAAPEHIVNKRALYDKVFPYLKNGFRLGQNVMPNPISAPEPEPTPITVVPGKQHPEQLFA